MEVKEMRMLMGILLPLILLAGAAATVCGDPTVRWVRPEGKPSYLLVGEEFEVVLEGIASEVRSTKPTSLRVQVGEAVEEPFIIVRFENGSQQWVKSRELSLNVDLLNLPMSLRLVGTIPNRFDRQKVRLISLHFLHGKTLVGEFSLYQQVFSRASAEAYEMTEKLQHLVIAIIILSLVCIILIVVLLARRGKKEEVIVLNKGGRKR
ncbi:MAG: hypothetical protein FGF48_11300 [Candidatus Brockarchaeota archaeon]|nr:hypothetical protein [Candidatus Brockarchaeota archaeon]